MALNQSCIALLVSLAVVISVAHSVSFFDLIQEEWNTFKLEHKKVYESELEEKFRMKIFMENKNRIAKHNAQFEKGSVSFKLGLNPFADMLPHEFVRTMNGFNYTLHKALREHNRDIHPVFMAFSHVKVDDEVDWRTEGAVTPVKNQGQCGSCWSFSATGALEGQHFRKFKKLVSLSEQNLIDCSSKYGNQGCEGGLMDQAFAYIKDNHGIDTEASYPYDGEDEKCRYKPQMSGATDKGFQDLPEGDEEALKHAVAAIGPISVAIDAGQPSFQLYKTGVYFDPECSPDNLDHGVLVVGYGTTEDGDDYWLVKNSWGRHWGDKGFIKMARNRDNNCGIASAASYPIV